MWVGAINASKFLSQNFIGKRSSRRLRHTQEKGVAEEMPCFYGN
jgi:hypothetical protein